MHFGGDDSSGKPLSLIRLLVAVFCIAVLLFLEQPVQRRNRKKFKRQGS